MNRIIKGLGIALGCVLIASSCSEISFGDKCRKGADQSIYRITLWATDRL